MEKHERVMSSKFSRELKKSQLKSVPLFPQAIKTITDNTLKNYKIALE
jgi:hypothetical protein